MYCSQHLDLPIRLTFVQDFLALCASGYTKTLRGEEMDTLAWMESVEEDRKNRPTKEVIKIEGVTVHANPLAG